MTGYTRTAHVASCGYRDCITIPIAEEVKFRKFRTAEIKHGRPLSTLAHSGILAGCMTIQLDMEGIQI